MSREASKKAAKELIALCEKEGVKLPTNALNAMIEAGTMLNATKEGGEFQLQKALKEMIIKFGQNADKKTKRKPEAKNLKEEPLEEDKEDTSKTQEKKSRKRTAKKELSDDDEDEEPNAKKARAKPTASCEDNQSLADAFLELSGFEFKRGERFKGGTWAKVAKAIREYEETITTGKQAMKLKGIGKSAAARIDEFIESGTMQVLEEYRAGNL